MNIMQDQDNMYDVIVVGAGLSGLMAAEILLRQEKKVLVIESNNTTGGIIKNYTIGQTMEYLNKKLPWVEDLENIEKTYIETGASEILTSHTFMIRLVQQFDMSFSPCYKDGKFLYFQKQGKIKKTDSLIDIYLSEKHQKTIRRLIAKIQNVSKNIRQAHDNMINSHSKKYYRNVLSEYIEFFDQMTVRQFLQKEIDDQSLRKMVINEFQIVQSISVDKISILQVFFHGYGLQNLKQITNKKTFFDESLRIREGVSALIEKLQEKIRKKGTKLSIKNPIKLSQPVLGIKNEINSEVQVTTTKGKYKCFKVFFTASIGRANSIKISKLSPAKRLIFQNQQSQQVQKIFLIFQSAFWRAKFSGSGVFSEEFPFSQINDVSPVNLACGILCFVLCGKKPRQWAQKFSSIELQEEKQRAMSEYLKKLLADAFFDGNMENENLKTMVMIPASLKDNEGYQTYTKMGICRKLDKESQDYLQCYSRDEHNIIFLGSELSKKFASCMEGAVRYTREKIFKYLEIEDPWNIKG